MKKLFIYYSLTGSGETLVESFKNHDYEIRRVKEKRKMPKSFFALMMVGGFRALIKAKGKLVDYNNDVSEYDEIVIGSPIWFDRLPPVTNSVIKKTDLKNKKLTFVLYSGSGAANKATMKVKKISPEANIIYLKEPKKYPDELKKLESIFDLESEK